MKQKILSLLVLLLTAATGAWADEATITLKCGTTEKTYENVTLPWSTTADILTEVITDYKNVASNIDAITGGDGKVVKFGNEQFTVNGTFSGEAKVVVSWYNSSKQSATITVTAPRPLMTLSDDGKTATMESMPASDVTVDYELVRDLSVETALNIFVIENEKPVALTEDSRLRIAKNGDNGYLPVNTLTCAFIDGIENVTMTPQQIIAAGMTPVFYLLGENDTWTPVPAANINPQTMLPTNIAPGQTYRMTLVANEGSIYDGETAPTFTITLFEGYPVEIAAGEYATFYKDENLYVEDEDAKLYTISSVEGDKAYLSSAFDAAPAYTPLLVFNSSEKPKTILLIPTEQEPNLALTVAPEFQGTLEGTTLQALLGCDSYVFNGKAFVWVKDEIAVPANKCWLAITTGTPNNAKTITIVFDEDATGVRSVDNGQLTMDNDVWYDLNGRKLNKKPTTKGIYIKNGKKVVIR